MKKAVDNKSIKVEKIIQAIFYSLIMGIIVVGVAVVKVVFFAGNINDDIFVYIAMNALILLPLCIFVALYMLFANRLEKFRLNKHIAYMVIFAVGTSMGILFSYITPYLIPVAFVALLIFSLSKNNSVPLVFNSFCAMAILASNLIEYILASGNVVTMVEHDGLNYLWASLVMTISSILMGAWMTYLIKRRVNRSNFIISCLIINVSVIALTFVLGNIGSQLHMQLADYWCLVIAAMLPLVANLMFVPLFERIFNILTDTRLLELVSAEQPLIRRMMIEAPGTYNHCMAVANFAEICANAIGEDVYMVRAAAYYHDIGKIENPLYFAENQSAYNPLDEVLPEVGAQIIRSHTENGYKLCQAYRIPEEIAKITLEHHGTMPIKIFYEKAKKLTDGEVNVKDYSHHTNKPTTKIGAIIMICDVSEAAIRAMDAPNGERIEKLLDSLIGERVAYRQFDECDISLKELKIIKHAIIEAYGGLFHKRIKYPSGERSE